MAGQNNAEAAQGAVNPYAVLPERIPPEQMIAEQETREPGDPTLGGRDPERDWLLRHA